MSRHIEPSTGDDETFSAPIAPSPFEQRDAIMAQHVLKSLGAFALTSALCLTLAPSQADARTGFADRIPNGNALGRELGGNGQPCALCHLSPSGSGPSNAFGQDARFNGPDWSVLYSLDSDNDGATNGEELCDPMGLFERGDADPVCDYTNPSDPNDFPAPVGMDMGMPDMDPPEDMGSPVEDMDTPPADMDAPVEDMSAPVEDMSAPVQDMSAPAEDMGGGGTPQQDMGGNMSGADMGTTPAADMASGGGSQDEEDDEGGCAQSGGSPVGGGMTLLGVLGMLGLIRRRR